MVGGVGKQGSTYRWVGTSRYVGTSHKHILTYGGRAVGRQGTAARG